MLTAVNLVEAELVSLLQVPLYDGPGLPGHQLRVQLQGHRLGGVKAGEVRPEVQGPDSGRGQFEQIDQGRKIQEQELNYDKSRSQEARLT